MSLQIYRDIIFKGPIKEWISKGDNFVLKEDGDLGYGSGNSTKQNIVK